MNTVAKLVKNCAAESTARGLLDAAESQASVSKSQWADAKLAIENMAS